MNPQLLKISLPRKSSFAINLYSHSIFPGIWQFHEEFEITFIVSGSGTRFVGNSIEQFEAGDLVLLGKNLPHTWRNHEDFCTNPQIDASQALVIHFHEDFLGPQFFNTPELYAVRQLLTTAQRGLQITGATKRKIIPKLRDLTKRNDAKKIIDFITVLDILAESTDLRPLSSDVYFSNHNLEDNQRLNKVYQYIINHFREDISLHDVSQIANMSPTSFSRYFKNRMRKSFSDFLINLKIDFACTLLSRSENMNISHVCFESGFRNISNFNKHFKKIIRTTPKKYQLKYSITPYHNT